MKITGKLKNAEVFSMPDGVFARGQIYGDVRGRFPDGEWIRTSYVTHIKQNIVTTRNSVYECEWASK